MKYRKHIINDETGISQVLESLIAIGISVSLLLIFFITANNIFVTHDKPGIDMEAKCIAIMESLLSSPGQDNKYESNWEKDPESISSPGIATSPTVTYGSFHMNEQGQITELYKKPFYDSSIGIAKTCFLAGTKIVMADGSYKNIENIVVGDIVKSFDVETGKITDGKVTDVLHHEPGEMGDYYLIINGFLRVTPNHQIYSNGRWIYASELKIGDSLFYLSRDYKVNSIEKIYEKVPTYDLEIGVSHCYFVAMDTADVLVHNGSHPQHYINVVFGSAGGYSGYINEQINFIAIITHNGGSGSGFPYHCVWTFGDGYSYPDEIPMSQNDPVTAMANHIYTQPDNYMVTLTVTCSCTPSTSGYKSTTANILYKHPPVAKFTWFDIDGLNIDTKIFFDASESTDEDGTIEHYYWDFYENGYNNDPEEIDSVTTYASFDLNSHKVSLKVTDNDGISDIYTCTVQANTLNLPDIEQAPWILTGKNVYSYNNEQTLSPCDENYYVQYTNLGNNNYSFEIKEKNSLYTIIDYDKITSLSKIGYWGAKLILGLNEISNWLYNFNITIISYAGGTTYYYGPTCEDATAIVSNSRDVLVYHKSKVNESDITDITPPYYENGKIILRLFIGGPPGNRPPNMPSNPDPYDGSTNVPNYNARLSWTCSDPDGDPLTYNVYLGTNKNNLPLVKSGLSKAEYNTGPMQIRTYYYWRVIAQDPYGASKAGPVWSFKTGDMGGTHRPPNTPSNPRPANESISVDIDDDLFWDGGDPESGDMVRYDIYFGTDSSPQYWSSVYYPWNERRITYDPGTMEYNTTYYWKINATDYYDNLVEGPIWQFTTRRDDPYKPNTPHPYNGEIDVKTVGTKLVWNGGDSEEGDEVTYEVYLGTDSVKPEYQGTISAPWNQMQIEYDIKKMDYGTTYYWFIRATDRSGDSVAGPIWQFTTEYNPYMPKNPSPTGGATDVDPANVILSWDGGDPEDGDNVNYLIFFGTTNPPEYYTETGYIPGNQPNPITYDLGLLEHSKTYYWKIEARDQGGSSTEGPIWHFTTIYNPYMPSNPRPDNNTIEIPIDTELSWDGGSPNGAGDEIIYYIYLGEEKEPELYDTIVLPGDDYRPTYRPHARLKEGTTYHWYIIATDKEGTTVGPTWMFTTTTNSAGPGIDKG